MPFVLIAIKNSFLKKGYWETHLILFLENLDNFIGIYQEKLILEKKFSKLESGQGLLEEIPQFPKKMTFTKKALFLFYFFLFSLVFVFLYYFKLSLIFDLSCLETFGWNFSNMFQGFMLIKIFLAKIEIFISLCLK